MNNGEPPLEKKNKSSIKPTLKPSLPNDLLLSCFARVSILYYPTLSLVSKRFRSLLASPELYKARSLLNRTESCLHVCLQFPSYDLNRSWFILCRKPKRTLTNKSSGYVLAKLPIPDSPPVYWPSLVAIGSNIYNIGGPNYKTPSSCVSILDCRSHTWLEAPNMQVERTIPSCSSVVDGKIYVAGGYEDSLNSIEVFDTKTQIWQYVPSPNLNINSSRCIVKSACLEGKFYMMIDKIGLAYNPKEGKWDLINNDMGLDGFWLSYCVIENVLFCCSSGSLKWYDTKVRSWKKLKGLVGISIPCFHRVELADYGGNMAVLWHGYFSYNDCKETTIWCAEIALEKHKDGEILGKVEWIDSVLTIPYSYDLMKVLGVTV